MSGKIGVRLQELGFRYTTTSAAKVCAFTRFDVKLCKVLDLTFYLGNHMFPSVILTFLLEVRLVSGAVHHLGDLVSGRQVHPAYGIV